ncbi:HAD-IA family hydrolase [Cupriavidus sp. AU9028]|uniref:HAD family hydrolase n=1 Tax=Cupriavidus sp. AU9028 TaxID=2871157 RepID=UPI001C9654B8|nr:HAD-IA family hydrolase [Cupriavidus sp. AU9028]MBY4895860.1 HAD-IA family hydrolase [Cupriavidus sp. AU9028]
MKVLIWNPPWGANGSLLHFRNCFLKHLAPQANTLATAGCSVDVVVPEAFGADADILVPNVRRIPVGMDAVIDMLGSFEDPALTLYAGDWQGKYPRLMDGLRDRLGSHYDAILLWENPVPFLEVLYPESVVVHQMPGVFSRAPYPQTVTFDPVGLYKHGTLHRYASDIVSSLPVAGSPGLVDRFRHLARSAFAEIRPTDIEAAVLSGGFEELVLLPLQVSGHYAFRADTPYSSQLDLLLDVMHKAKPSSGIVVTQYISNHVQDTVINEEIRAVLAQRWPNLVYDRCFDQYPTVSQYLLPYVGRVVSCSSSVALQAMLWDADIDITAPTFLEQYSTENIVRMAGDRRPGYDNVLDFILSRHQPLARLVIEDRNFLLQLLSSMVKKKRSGKAGLELLCDFREIDSGYEKKLLGEFSSARALKSVKEASPRLSAEMDDISKAARGIRDPRTKVISFDVFDTLISRAVEVPADAYRLLEAEAVRMTAGRLEDFARVRLAAEIAAREANPDGEITFDDIYDAISAHYGLSDAERARLMDLEVDVEYQLIDVRPFGRRIWQLAVESGKRIVLVSDMYLPARVVRKFLDKAGYAGYEHLFVSSEYGARKKTGDLYDVALARVGCKPEEMFHVGDNKVADVEQAAAKGVRPYRLLRAIDRMRGNPHYKTLFDPRASAGERPRSAIAGLIARTVFDAPGGAAEKDGLFTGSPFRLGYAALGPLVAGYVLWLGRRAKVDGVSKLFFLAREGWLLHQVYKALFNGTSEEIPNCYLYASRRAARVAALRTEDDIRSVAAQPFVNGARLSDLLGDRFGVRCEDVPAAVLEAAGIASVDLAMESSAGGRLAFTNLCVGIKDLILAKAEGEREPYLQYLTAQNLDSEPAPAVVDIGWKANMQGSLGALLGKPLGGYYLATLQGAERWLHQGHRLSAYLGDYLVQGYAPALVNNRHLLEFLTCHTDRSLERMTREGDRFVPVMRMESEHASRRLLIQEVHRGAMAFAADLRGGYGELLQHIHIDPSTASRVMSEFITRPCPADAALLRGVAFEDSFGGIRQRYVISPRDRDASVWRQGFDCLSSNTQGDSVVATRQQASTASVKSHRASHETAKTVSQPVLIFRRVEGRIVRWVGGERKYRKYLRDRTQFFADSKNLVWKRWAKVAVPS